MPKKLRLSYSSLQFFFESRCPAAWNFREHMRPKAVNEFAARGLLVHSMMEGKTDVSTIEDKAALMYYAKLRNLEAMLGLQIVDKDREIWREVDIRPGVNWVGKIDFKGTLATGNQVIGDYKTTGNGWKSFIAPSGDTTTPQALSFQGIGYLIRGTERKWPKTALFLIVGFRGEGTVVPYDYVKSDEINLLDAIDIVKRAKTFPKVHGKHCLNMDGKNTPCEFFDACFKTQNWEDKYDERV